MSEPIAGNDVKKAAWEAHARAFHEDGFVALDTEDHTLKQDQVASVLSAVLTRYEQFMAVAKTRAIDLDDKANSERIPGFYVREGGRIDMQLASMIAALPVDKDLISGVDPIEIELLQALESKWHSVVDAIFQAPAHETNPVVAPRTSSYRLEYIGCVVARPGDSDQNWHLDGVHRNPTKHEPADRINVFVPLVDITPDVGGTEMKKRSQFRDDGSGGRRGTQFDDYADLESVTHYVAAGTPVVMDYRVWHRGKANGSSVLRSLLYFKYTRNEPREIETATNSGRKRLGGESADDSGVMPPLNRKAKKRVALVTVSK